MNVSRCLIADPDSAAREYLASVLGRWGLGSVLSGDGQDAAYWLGLESFDAAFLSLTLPGLTGSHLAGLLQREVLRKPICTVLMGTSAELAAISDLEWAQRVHFLSKPFGAPDVRGLLERALGSRLSTVVVKPRRGVALVGRGFWSEAAAKVISLRRAPAMVVAGVADLPEVAAARPAVIVVGPPLADSDIVVICAEIRHDPAFGGASVIAALNRADADFRADLLTIGVDRTLPVVTGLERLTGDILHLAGLTSRRAPRVEMSSVVRVSTADQLELARAFDVGEGGLGLRVVTDSPTSNEARVEFVLPGEDHVISAEAEIAWTRSGGDDRVQIGMRFLALENEDRDRIRNYVFTQSIAA